MFHTAGGERVPCESHITLLYDDGERQGTVGVVRNISDRHERERELAEEKALVESVFRAIPDVFFTIDDQGELIRWNDRVSELMGYTDAEIAEMDPMEFVAEEDRAGIVEAIATAFADDGVETREAAYLTKEGRRIAHEFNGTCVIDEDGTVIGVVGMGRDITDRTEHERALERQNDRLEEFASVLSHDLRNPLGVATGYLDRAHETGEAADFKPGRTCSRADRRADRADPGGGAIRPGRHGPRAGLARGVERAGVRYRRYRERDP
jgi:PAS domain S-box-containing protein